MHKRQLKPEAEALRQRAFTTSAVANHQYPLGARGDKRRPACRGLVWAAFRGCEGTGCSHTTIVTSGWQSSGADEKTMALDTTNEQGMPLRFGKKWL